MSCAHVGPPGGESPPVDGVPPPLGPGVPPEGDPPDAPASSDSVWVDFDASQPKTMTVESASKGKTRTAMTFSSTMILSSQPTGEPEVAVPMDFLQGVHGVCIGRVPRGPCLSMVWSRCARVAAVGVTLGVGVTPAKAVEIDASARTSGRVERGGVVVSDVPSASGDFETTRLDEERLLVGLALNATWAELGLWRLELGLDSGELEVASDGAITSNGRSFADEAAATWLLRTAWLSVTPSVDEADTTRLRLGGGRRLQTVGEGLVLDDVTTGSEVGLDTGPWSLAVAYFLVGPELDAEFEPMWTVTVERALGFLRHASAFFAYYDGEVFDDSWRRTASRLESDLRSGSSGGALSIRQRARVAWWGGHLTWTSGPWTFVGTVAVDTGVFENTTRLVLETQATRRRPARVRVLERTTRRDLLGGASDLSIRRRLADTWFGTVFVHTQTGTDPDDTDDWNAWVAVQPWYARPSVFFDSGLSASFRNRRGVSGGVGGAGLLAPGVELLFAPDEAIEVELSVAHLRALEDSPIGHSRLYGHEASVRANVGLPFGPTEVELGAEAGALRQADFFPEPGWTWRLGVNAVVYAQP